jgi:hypothetical protein
MVFTHTGEPGDYFTAAAADGMVGKVFDVVGPGRRLHRGVVVAAEPVEEGLAVQLQVVIGAEVIVRVGQLGR